MRNIALTLRQAILLLLIVWGLFTVLIAAGERVSPQWRAPGLIILVVLVGIEATITQRLVARERLRFEEQAGVRLVELIVVVVLVRVWSLLAENQALLDAMKPWLRTPLQFFNGRFGEYFLWALAAWGFTTLLSSDVLGWDTGATPIMLPEESIERAQVEQEWSQTVARYDWRFTVVAVITLMASGFALSTVRAPDVPPLTASPGQITVAALAVVVAGVLLHGAGRLNQLRRSWSADRIEEDGQIASRWSRTGLLVMAGLLIIAPLMGLVVLIIPAPPLIPVANALLLVMTVIVSLVVLLLGLLLAPLILLLSLLGGSGRPAPLAPPTFTPPQIIEGPRERPLLPALIFWGCVVILVMVAIARYIDRRSDLRESLRQWRLWRWLVGQSRELWLDTRGWLSLAAERVGRLMRHRSPRVRPSLPSGAQAQLRSLYRRMRQGGARRGVPAGQAQTPYEFGEALARTLPAAEQDVKGLTEVYVTAEYGPVPARTADVRRAREHWRRLHRWLVSSSRVRRR
jgi:hypothetical protein